MVEKNIVNPELAPMTFAVSIEHPNGTEILGSFSLYPPDQPGVFRFSLPDNLQQIKQLTNAYVIIKYDGGDDQTLAKNVNVVFNSLKWE